MRRLGLVSAFGLSTCLIVSLTIGRVSADGRNGLLQDDGDGDGVVGDKAALAYLGDDDPEHGVDSAERVDADSSLSVASDSRDGKDSGYAAEFAAVVRSSKSAVLSSQIDGFIAEIGFAEGESFEEGDTLLSIDCTIPTAEHKKARSHLRFAEQEHAANVQLSQLDSISDVALARSAAEVEKAKVDSGSTRYQVDQCALVAPFSGDVVKWHVQQYETIPAKSQVVEIVNNSELRVEFLLPSEYLTRLGDQQDFELLVLETDLTYSAEVVRVIPQVDSVSQTVKVVGQITSDDGALWSGMSGLARFPAMLN